MVFVFIALRCPLVSATYHGSFDVCPRIPVHGDSCTFRCDPGYRLTDVKPVVCEQTDGVTFWAGEMPRCKRESARVDRLVYDVSNMAVRSPPPNVVSRDINHLP